MLKFLFLAVIGLFLSLEPNTANAQGIAAQLDWVNAWGTLDLTSANDPIIPAARHGVKRDIKFTAQACKPAPIDPDFSKDAVYAIDYDNDGVPDYINDSSVYFAGPQIATCPQQICRADGCNTPVYHNDGDTQILEGTPDAANPCPATASDNTTCRPECAALEPTCPALFNHVRTLSWMGRTLGWSFIRTSDYTAMRESVKALSPSKNYIYRQALNNNPVFKAVRDRSYCTMEEMDPKGTGTIPSGTPCVKYMQFTKDVAICSDTQGCFLDLYQPTVISSPADSDSRYIDSELDASGKGIRFFDKAYSVAGRADTSIDGVDVKGMAFKLKTGYAISTQVPDFDVNAANNSVCQDVPYDEEVCDGAMGRQTVCNPCSDNGCHIEHKTKRVCSNPTPKLEFVCREYSNTSGKDVFIPAQTDMEYQAFVNAAQSGEIPDVKVKECERKFTPWVGTTSCAMVNPSCNQTIKIAAERTCIRSTSATASCDECTGMDTQVIPGFRDACFFSTVCVGPPCPLADVICLAPDTLITLADGSKKTIAKLKSGDMVQAFSSEDPLKPLTTAKVATVTVTGKKEVIRINGLRITAEHKIVTEGGGLVAAKDIKVGDKIITDKGVTVTVKTVRKLSKPITVYNMHLDNADGFIADGMRVLDYPMP